MNSKYYILFFLRSQKTNSSGLTPIYLRVTIAGKRLELSTQQYVDPLKWSIDSGGMKGYSQEAKSINDNLQNLRTQVQESISSILKNKIELSIENLKSALKPKKLVEQSLIDIFHDHNSRISALLGEEFAFGTYKKYETTLRHLKEFIRFKYGKDDYSLKDVNTAFIIEFEFYLRSVRKCANNSAVKYIRNFGKIIRQCISYGWIDKNPFMNYKSKLKIVDRDFLSEEELNRLLEKDYLNERLNLVKDIFLFSCYTGLAYVDVQKLTRMEVVLGIDGEKWIHTSREKTDVKSHIPLLPIPLDILEKYADHPQCLNKGKLLPVLSNQKMNAYLKEIADLCGITKTLTFHVARHTFATTVTLSNGVPIETVSKMLGHTSLKTTQHYAKILDIKISQDMSILKEKYSRKQLPKDLVSKLK